MSLAFAASLVVAALALDRAFPPDLRRMGDVGTELTDRAGRPLALWPAVGGTWRFDAGTEDVAPGLTALLVATEDRRFWWHPGVDPLALARAVAQWARSGRVVSGGSTIAMQAARLLTPRPRTIGAKLIEMARAVQLEFRYGRAGVLRIWLTLAPYGGNLEGARAGALAWFGREPSALEPAEAALLVAIPRRPEALRPDRHPRAAETVRARVLTIAARAGLPASNPLPPVPDARRALPRHAPQVLTTVPGGGRVATTLDLPTQTALEALCDAMRRTLPPRASLAVLIADTRARQILAIDAGAWGNPARAGAVDLTRALRSPGSALKPFLYAMAFEDGLAAPDTALADSPRLFGAYAPENFDRGFAGRVTAADALRQSLNLPAVALLDRVGPARFAAALRDAGAALRLPGDAPASLPLALGGVGITLRDAAALYAALATDGSARPLAWRADDAAPARPFLTPGAAAQVAEVLTRPLPGATEDGSAWKTGTSWGGRDGWAFGFDQRHVVAVWIGRPDGTPLPAASGARLALPVLAQAFGLLPASPRPHPASQQPTPRPAAAALPAADALTLLFPPPGAVLAREGSLTIRAMGGRRPLTFLVDGAPIAAEPVRREAAWLPPGPGFYRLTVLDADGAAAHAAVRVR